MTRLTERGSCSMSHFAGLRLHAVRFRHSLTSTTPCCGCKLSHKLGKNADNLQSVETRLIEENKALSMERSHRSDLMANVQKMHNDIERLSEND